MEAMQPKQAEPKELPLMSKQGLGEKSCRQGYSYELELSTGSVVLVCTGFAFSLSAMVPHKGKITPPGLL